jgi:hypothetical protein
MRRRTFPVAMVGVVLAACGTFLASTPAHAASQAIATSVALNDSVADCGRADLNIGVEATTVDREFGRATNKYGFELGEFDNPSTLSGTTGVISYGIPIDGEQPDGTIIGSYASLGTAPPQTATTAEWFVLYECDTGGANTVLYTCFGDYGTCPQTAAQAIDGLLSVSVSNANPTAGETITVTATGCSPDVSAVAAVTLLRENSLIASVFPITPPSDGVFSVPITVPADVPGGTQLVLRTVCGDGDAVFASFDVALTVAGGDSTPTDPETEPGSTTAPEPSTQPRFTG